MHRPLLSTMSDATFPREIRILRGADFERVFASKVYAADGVLVMSAEKSESGRTRLGLSVSRKVGNAVIRNRWKRLIREAFRLQKHELPPGFDLVVRPKAGARPIFADVYRSLPKMAKRVARALEQSSQRKGAT